ncbi:MAG: DUF6338 family protein [Termitinemataceae bacterium]|nr:MAG: DUF6338 family protein [Termitinemataceae bacterium]
MEFLTESGFGLFVLIVAPGFLSLKVWALIHPSRRVSFADSLYEAVFYGVVNYFLVAVWMLPLMAKQGAVWKIIALITALVIVPLLLPHLWKWILSWKSIRKRIINPIPKAWDVFFGKQKPCFMLVHLNNGQVIGGLYAYNSASSSYPEEEDLYLEKIYEIDDAGKLTKPIDGSLGLLVNCKSIDYIELLEADPKENDHAK